MSASLHTYDTVGLVNDFNYTQTLVDSLVSLMYFINNTLYIAWGEYAKEGLNPQF